MRRPLSTVASCIIVFAFTTASAQPAPTLEADRLFQEGLALFDKGQFDDACKKFEQSIAKDPRALGTLMNLGRCNERRGKVATAQKLYQEAFDRASESNATVARDKAQERIAALAAQVPVVTLERAGPPLEGEKLVIDDQVISSDKQELLLDPGAHTLVLTAPGRLPYQTTINATIKSRIKVELPVLAVPAQRTVVTRVRSSQRRLIGKIATFGGGGLVLVGGGLMVYGRRDYDKQFEDPDGPGTRIAPCAKVGNNSLCNATGQSRTERDRNLVTAGTVFGVVGLAAAATGLALWLTAPAEERTTIVPTGTATGVGLAVVGTF